MIIYFISRELSNDKARKVGTKVGHDEIIATTVNAEISLKKVKLTCKR
jgi:hypothetical protein